MINRSVAGCLRRLSFCLSTRSSVFDRQFYFTELTGRELLIIRGSETRKFMQGVVTNDVDLLYLTQNDDSQVALYTLFLNPKGKVVNDGIVIRPVVYRNGRKQRTDNELWVDIDCRFKDILWKHLQRYTWKKDVEILNVDGEDQDRPHLHAGFTSIMNIQMNNDSKSRKPEEEAENFAGKLVKMPSAAKEMVMEDGCYADIGFHDPRSPSLGVRIICSGEGFDFQEGKQVVPVEQYEKHCRLHGLTSPQLMINKLPFMFNADLFNGFSFTKGCYLGQEIVARAYHTGIVRRRIFPFSTSSEAGTSHQIESDCILRDEKGVQLGKVIQVTDQVGTLLMNYIPRMSESWPIPIASPWPGLIFNPFSRKLSQYMKQMRAKQQKLELMDI